MKSWIKFERKSVKLKDWRSKILTLLSDQENEKECGRNLWDVENVINILTNLDLVIEKFKRL